MNSRFVSRRHLIETLALGASVGTLIVRQALAGEARRLDVKDPAAVALGYVENAAQVDVKKYPAYVKGSTCNNCLQLQGKAGDAYRPCNLYPDKLVAAAGWCASWTAEM
jgi:hypothetical protein